MICYMSEVGRYAVSNRSPSLSKADIAKRDFAE